MSLNIAQQRSMIGIAIGREEIIAVRTHERGAEPVRVSVSLTGTAEDAGLLGDAFARLRDGLDAVTAKRGRMDGALVSIALLPPLVDTRIIALPPMRPAEAQAVLRRDAARHFVGVHAPHLVAVHEGDRARRQESAGIVAAAVSTSFVDAVSAAAAATGWRVHLLAPAHSAWTAAAAARQGTGAYVAVADGIAHIVRLSGRRAAGLRRVPAAASGDVIEAVADAGRVALFVPTEDRAAIEGGLTGAVVPTVTGDAYETAARYAEGDGIRFISPAAAAERHAQQRRTAIRFAVAAALLIVMAAVIDAWGARRELDVLRARRAEIRSQVGPLLATRDSIDRLITQMQAVEDRARSTPRWTPALFDLAMLLPEESHLTGLFANGDTLVIEAQGTGAGAALQALRSAGSLQDARLVGTIDRELDGGATAMERFRLSARLADSPGAAVARADERTGEER